MTPSLPTGAIKSGPGITPPSGRGRGREASRTGRSLQRQRPGDETQRTVIPGKPVPGPMPVALVTREPVTVYPGARAQAHAQLTGANPLDRALSCGTVEQALSQAVYMSYQSAAPESMYREELERLQASYSRLIEKLSGQPQEEPGGESGLPLALEFLNINLLTPQSLRHLCVMKERLCCSAGEHGGLMVELQELRHQTALDPLDNAERIAAFYQRWRPLLSGTLLHQLAEVYRRVVPEVLTSCEQMGEADSQMMPTLERLVIPFLDLLYWGFPLARSAGLRAELGERLMRLLTRNLAQKPDGSLTAESRVIWEHMVRYCVAQGVLDETMAQGLEQKIADKAVALPAAEGVKAQVISAEQLLREGRNQQALELCLKQVSEHPERWGGTGQPGLFRQLKMALKGELASLCMQLWREGLQREVAQRYQRLTLQLGIWKTMPWMIGRENYCALSTLYSLLSSVIKPRRKGAGKRRGEGPKLVQLGSLSPGPGEVGASPKQQLDPWVEESTAKPTYLQQASKFLAAGGREHAHGGDKKGAIPVSEAGLKQLLHSNQLMQDFITRMNRYPQQSIVEAGQWMVLIQRLLAEKSIPQVQEGSDMAKVIAAAARLVISDLMEKMVEAPDEAKYKTGMKVAGCMVEQLNITSCLKGAVKESYRELRELVVDYFVLPFKNQIVAEARSVENKVERQAVKRLFIEIDQFVPLLKGRKRNELRMIYTEIFWSHDDWDKVFWQLKSEKAEEFQQALTKLEHDVMDMKNYFSWKAIEHACLNAKNAINKAIGRLETMVQLDKRTWEPIRENFIRKYRGVLFLMPDSLPKYMCSE